MQSLLTWTARATFHTFLYPPGKHPRYARGSIFHFADKPMIYSPQLARRVPILMDLSQLYWIKMKQIYLCIICQIPHYYFTRHLNLTRLLQLSMSTFAKILLYYPSFSSFYHFIFLFSALRVSSQPMTISAREQLEPKHDKMQSSARFFLFVLRP